MNMISLTLITLLHYLRFYLYYNINVIISAWYTYSANYKGYTDMFKIINTDLNIVNLYYDDNTLNVAITQIN